MKCGSRLVLLVGTVAIFLVGHSILRSDDRAHAATIVIDGFTTSQTGARVCPEVGPLTNSSVAAASEALGGERDIYVETTSQDITNPTNCMFVGVNYLESYFSSNVQQEVTGSVEVQWDGADGNPTTLDAMGLGGVDLTDGGVNDQFLLRIIDNNIGIPSMDITVYTDASNYSTYSLNLGFIFDPQNRYIPFADFTTAAGTGADFTNVGAITWTFSAGPSQSGPNVRSFEVISSDTTPPESFAFRSGTLGLNGWYTTPVEVALSATDDSSGVNEIQYRIDGGAWNIYTSPFMISTEGDSLLEFFATDNAGNVEPTQQVEIRIDTVDPDTAISFNGTVGLNGWYTSSVEVTLSGFDATSGVLETFYRINEDGAAWEPYVEPFVLSESGVYDIDYYTADTAGNLHQAKSTTVNVDLDAPVTAAALTGIPGNAGWYTSDVEVTLSSEDVNSGVDKIQYRVDGGSWNTYTSPFTISADGQHLVEYAATDIAGNVESTKALDVDIDQTEPVIDDGGPYEVGEGQVITLDANGSSDETSGVAEIAWDLDQDGSFESGNPANFSYPDGPDIASVDLRVTDAAGNATTASVDVAVNNLPPVINAISVSDNSVTVSASDPAGDLDTLSYSFDCDNDLTYEIGPQSTNSVLCDFGSAEGDFSVNLLVEDEDGGEVTGSAEVIVETSLCANRYNGDLRYVPSGRCASTEFHLMLPYDAPLELCANRYNGDLRYSRTGRCASTEWGIVLPDEGPLHLCVNRYNGDMRVARSENRCASTEFYRMIGN